MTEKIVVYLWKETSKEFKECPKGTLDKITIKAMPDNKDSYNPEINARQFAKLIVNCLPGDTLYLMLDFIAAEIKPMLDNPDKIDILKSPLDIENKISGALYELSNMKG